jgi:alpha-galactosidase
MGSHIASGRSHTTGRRHDLGFRAATAIFGHLGIEWDLTEAADTELAELRAWIGFFKDERHLLLRGDLVRMDGADARVLLHGVVAPDRSRAIFAAGSTDSLYPDPPARLKFRGLDPSRRYRLRPVLVGSVPSGLKPPAWWGGPVGTRTAGGPPFPPRVAVDAQFPGDVFTGSALEHVGVACHLAHPDQVVLYRADATDGAGY